MYRYRVSKNVVTGRLSTSTRDIPPARSTVRQLHPPRRTAPMLEGSEEAARLSSSTGWSGVPRTSLCAGSSSATDRQAPFILQCARRDIWCARSSPLAGDIRGGGVRGGAHDERGGQNEVEERCCQLELHIFALLGKMELVGADSC